VAGSNAPYYHSRRAGRYLQLMLVRIEANKFLESLKQTRENIDSYGLVAWNRALEDSKEAMHQHGYQNKTGKLTASMKSKSSSKKQFAWTGTITISATYAQWVDQGTGIYGPLHMPIRPRVAPFLRFFWDKTGRIEYMRSVRGMKPAKFSQMAIERFLAVAHSYVQAAVDSASRS